MSEWLELCWFVVQTNPEESDGEPPKLVICDADLLKVRLFSSELGGV